MKKKIKKFRKRYLRPLYTPLASLLLLLINILTAFLPYFILKPLATILSLPVLLLSYRRNKILWANLKIAFPNSSIWQKLAIHQSSIMSVILTFLEVSWFSRHLNKLQETVEIAPQFISDLKERQERQAGTILIIPHLGNWELGGLALEMHGIDMAFIAKPINNPYLSKVISNSRNSLGSQIIPAKGAARAGLKALKCGKTLGLLMDQNTEIDKGGVFCDFFGLPAPVTRLPAKMAMRGDNDIKVLAFIRQKRGIKLVEEPIGDLSEMDEKAITDALVLANLKLITKYRGQWLWHYRRWRFIAKDSSPELMAKYPFYSHRQSLM